MGYESKVIIARRYDKTKQDNVLDIVAELELSKMGGDFLNLFTNEWATGYQTL